LAIFIAAIILLDASNKGPGELATKCLTDPATASADWPSPPQAISDRSPEVGASSKDGEKLATNLIAIENFTFRPPVLTVPAGTKVTWINSDDVPHTATSTNKVFASPTLDTDDRFEFVFDKPGTFEYFCAVHRHMVGKVIVTKPVKLSQAKTKSQVGTQRAASSVPRP
jgi:plastocyanin